VARLFGFSIAVAGWLLSPSPIVLVAVNFYNTAVGLQTALYHDGELLTVEYIYGEEINLLLLQLLLFAVGRRGFVTFCC
jgi:hypothetical protein